MVCRMAHASEEVNPRKCNREGGGAGVRIVSTRLFVSLFTIAKPKKSILTAWVLTQIIKSTTGVVIKNVRTNTLNEKITEFDLDNVPEKDKAYVRRTQNSIHHISLKRKWLYKRMIDAWARQEARESRYDKYREQYREMLDDRDSNYE